MVSGWSLWMAKDIVFYNERDDISTWGWLWRVGLFLWMLFQSFSAGSLALFHGYLISTAQTTFECIKPKKLQRRIEYEREKGRFMDIASKRKSGGGICGFVTSVMVELGGGIFTCFYPFSEGIIRNWYGFVTAECLERKEYFETGPVVLVNPPVEPQETQNGADHIVAMNGMPNGSSTNGADV